MMVACFVPVMSGGVNSCKNSYSGQQVKIGPLMVTITVFFNLFLIALRL
jgi:hypothetical protein